MGSRIGDLLRQLAIAYDDMQLDMDNRFNYQEDRVNKQDKQLFKIKAGLKSLVSSLESEEDSTYDFRQN